MAANRISYKGGASVSTSENLQPSSMPQEVELMLNVKTLYSAFQERVSCEVRAFDLPQPDILMIIRLTQPTRLGRLAEDAQVLPSTMTAIADRLEEQGIVCRVRDQNDRRAWLVQLTDEGRNLQAEIYEHAKLTFEATTGLSPQDTTKLHELMAKVSLHIRETGYPKGLEI
jgi:DNA-binding MarR family transcriptional regulator